MTYIVPLGNTSITDGNGNYSVAGATYGVFSDKDCTKQLATLTTDENGNTDVVEVKAGTVYIKELSAPAGYKVDKTVYSLKVEAGKTATLKVSDIPKVTDTLIELFKIDMETQKDNPQGNASLAGAEFTWKYYAGFYNKDNLPAEANAVKENIKDMPTQTAYAVYSAKEKAKSSVSDFKRGMVQEQQSRQTGRLEKQEQHRQNIADKRMELQKAQEARQAQRKADGSATTGATRPHERPATASTIPKPSAEKMQEVKRPATATTSKASEPVKTNVVKERPLSSGASDKKATQPAQPVHRQNVEKVVSQETRQNYKAERTTKKQTFEQSKRTTEHTEKNRNLVTKKGQKKK